jgi:hypothetical protein
MPARAAVAVVVTGGAILRSTLLRYGSNGLNGRERIKTLVENIMTDERNAALIGFDSFHWSHS